MRLSKKQVKAFLDVMSSDTARPVLTAAMIDKHNEATVLVATNGYVLAELFAPELTNYVGQFVPRSELIKWYKLAATKDVLTEEAVIPMLTSEYENYPKWQGSIDNLSTQPVDQIAVNPRYLTTMADLAGVNLTWQFNGRLAGMKALFDNNTYIVMPLKD